MKTVFVPVALALLLCTITGCSSAESLVKKQISLMNEYADAVDSGASDDKLKSIEEKIESNNKKLEKISKSKGEKVVEKHKDELMKAAMRYVQAKMKKGMEKLGTGGGFPGFPDNSKVPEGFPKP